MARTGALRPEDMLPRDWGTMIRLLGEVGSATDALGGMAHDAGRAFEQQIKWGITVAAETFDDANAPGARVASHAEEEGGDVTVLNRV